MLAKEAHRALERKLGVRWAVRGSVATVETMIRARIDVKYTVRDRLPNSLDRVGRDRPIELAEVIEDRAFRLLVQHAGDPRPVVRDRGIDRQLARCNVRDRSAPAKTHDPDTEISERFDGRLHVGERVLPVELLHRRSAALDLRIIEHEAALDAIEQRRRNGGESFRRITVDDALHVRGQAENLLHHDDAADRLAGGIGPISVEGMPVTGRQSDLLSHALVVFDERALAAGFDVGRERAVDGYCESESPRALLRRR